jgi:hypothetical protein
MISYLMIPLYPAAWILGFVVGFMSAFEHREPVPAPSPDGWHTINRKMISGKV